MRGLVEESKQLNSVNLELSLVKAYLAAKLAYAYDEQVNQEIVDTLKSALAPWNEDSAQQKDKDITQLIEEAENLLPQILTQDECYQFFDESFCTPDEE